MAAKSPTPPETISNTCNNKTAWSNSESSNQKNYNNNNRCSSRRKSNDDNNSKSHGGNLSLDRSATPLISLKTNSNNNNDSNSSSSGISCPCTNITIMHLFHEMKQEFPTIPDTVVAEYVNRYCHQRDECVSELRRELATYSMRLLSFPTKALHAMQNNGRANSGANNHDKSHDVLAKPLRPIRPAPTHPSQQRPNNAPSEKSPDAINPKLNTVNSASNHLQKQNVCPVPSQQKPTINASKGSSQDCMTTCRTRPTTLNLRQNRPILKQKQCNLLNIHLQQQQQSKSVDIKPIRKAPPPPSMSPNASTKANSYAMSLQHQQHIALEATSNTTSPLSESEISVNVSLSASTSSTPTSLLSVNPNLATTLKSPIRHRSVITLQPKLPNICNFQISTSTSTGESADNPYTVMTIPSESTATPVTTPSQKSFTSVNLTLRQPVETANWNSPAPSTIDIKAGPIVKGAIGSGLTYSSTSYNAKNRCQKNFHITVTDEGGEISAYQIATHPQLQLQNEEENHHNDERHRRQPEENPAVDINSQTVPDIEVNEAFAEAVIERQKKRRDKLAAVLRENKKRLIRIKMEINILMEPIQPDVTSKLDDDIHTLRNHCQELINQLENVRRHGSDQLRKRNKPKQREGLYYQRRQTRHQPCGSQFIQSQTFLQFRSPLQQHRLRNCTDLRQVSSSSSPSTQATPAILQINSPTAEIKLSTNNTPESTSSEFRTQASGDNVGNHQAMANIEAHHNFVINMDNARNANHNNNTDDDIEQNNGEEIMPPPWECNMCTFHNHPELNICECCDNVRIIPGTLTHRAIARANSHLTPVLGNRLAGEPDCNFNSKQFANFALPTS